MKANPAIDDEEMYKNSKFFPHGQTKDALAKMQLGSWEYGYRYTGLQYDGYHVASIGLVQSSTVTLGCCQRRKDTVDRYDRGFAGTVSSPTCTQDWILLNLHATSGYHPCRRSKRRTQTLSSKLAKAGIASTYTINRFRS